jgi:hypothetical protein
MNELTICKTTNKNDTKNILIKKDSILIKI